MLPMYISWVIVDWVGFGSPGCTTVVAWCFTVVVAADVVVCFAVVVVVVASVVVVVVIVKGGLGDVLSLDCPSSLSGNTCVFFSVVVSDAFVVGSVNTTDSVQRSNYGKCNFF